jgi:hypothetical protein
VERRGDHEREHDRRQQRGDELPGRIASIDIVNDPAKLRGLAVGRGPAGEPSQARGRKGRTPGTTYPAA